MLMIAFITSDHSSVLLIEGLCSSDPCVYVAQIYADSIYTFYFALLEEKILLKKKSSQSKISSHLPHDFYCCYNLKQ